MRFGAVEALRDGPRTPRQVADACGTEPEATGKLLFALAGARYLKAEEGRYKLTRLSRKWLLAGGKSSLRDKLLLQFHEWASSRERATICARATRSSSTTASSTTRR